MTIKYRAFWSAQAFALEKAEIVDLSFFSPEHCYDPQDIAAIRALRPGQTWHSPDFGHYHTVTAIDASRFVALLAALVAPFSDYCECCFTPLAEGGLCRACQQPL